MKILLLGEFSALHKNLKDGLVELGHDVTIASNRDGWKNIPNDINFNLESRFLPKQLSERILPFKYLNKFSGYDVVQFVNPFIFYKNYFPNKYYLNKIINNNDKTFLLAAGCDSYYWKFACNILKYGPFEDTLKYDLKTEESVFVKQKFYEFNKYFMEKSNGVIPIMYDYEIGYGNSEKLLNTIPIPMNINQITYKPNIVKDKIVILHGLNRYGFKGTRYVEEAFRILNDRYPDKLELIIDGGMSLDDYLRLMQKAHIIIDQTNSYSNGINAIYGLAMGKIVLGGAEPESYKSIGINDSPTINILPHVESIVSAIDKLINEKHQFETLGYESRKFAEIHHNHIKVAEKYINTWNQSK